MLWWLCNSLQIMDLEGLSHEEASNQVTSRFQGLLEELPGAHKDMFLPQLCCIPGCILLLANLAVMQDVHAMAGEGAQFGGEVFSLAGEDEAAKELMELTEINDEIDFHDPGEEMESVLTAVTNET
jgi:hypothetical protein